MFVRTKKVGDKRYKQLVENYRENGQHKQRVLAHLGKHDTPQDALEALRAELDDHHRGDIATKVSKARMEARLMKQQLEAVHADALERWHDGELPSLREYQKRRGDGELSPETDEVEMRYMGYTKYKREKRERTPEQVEYNRSFADGEETPLDDPNMYGYTSYFPGVVMVQRSLESYEFWVREAAAKQAEYERRETKLEERIAKLESVVTKA